MKLLLTGMLALALFGGASAQEREREPSNYTQFKGEPFFLLSDASYGSLDEARVRLEVPGLSLIHI